VFVQTWRYSQNRKYITYRNKITVICNTLVLPPGVSVSVIPRVVISCCLCSVMHFWVHRVGEKSGATDCWPYFCQVSTDLNVFTGKFTVKWVLILPHLAYVATLPCETLISAKQALNDRLQGSVATYLRCGEFLKTKLRFIAQFVR